MLYALVCNSCTVTCNTVIITITKYIYIYIYTYIHIYIYTYIHIYIYTYIHIYIYTYIHIHIYIYTYIHIYLYTYIPIYLYTYIHIYIYTYIHIYIYTYIHCMLDTVCTQEYTVLCQKTPDYIESYHNQNISNRIMVYHLQQHSSIIINHRNIALSYIIIIYFHNWWNFTIHRNISPYILRYHHIYLYIIIYYPVS